MTLNHLPRCDVDGALEVPLLLSTGPLTAHFDPSTASLRGISWHGSEALMGVFAAVRDRAWGTVPPRLSGLDLSASGDGLRIGVEALCRRGGVHFGWRGDIVLAAAGWLEYRFEGEVLGDFERNRIGLCVLHGATACAGRPCRVVHTSGAVEDGVFPTEISPHQPFTAIAAISHTLAHGGRCTVSFSGEVFEMEDQRNWSDASFKTYGTPLGLPFPVLVRRGERVTQAVRVTFEPPAANRPRRRPRGRSGAVRIGSAVEVRPRIVHRLGDALPDAEAEGLLRDLIRPDAVQAEIDLTGPDWALRVTAVHDVSRRLGVPWEGVLVAPPEADRLRSLQAHLGAGGAGPSRWLVLSAAEPCTPAGLLSAARSVLGGEGGPVRFGLGTRGNFAELNRGRPVAAEADFVAYALAVEVHATDRLTIMENVEAAGWTVAAARRLYPGTPVAVTPVSFCPQFNPAAAAGSPAAAGVPAMVPARADPRQATLFGCSVALGMVRSLAAAGAADIALFELAGGCGLLEPRHAPRRPAGFPDRRGQVFPLFHVLADLRACAGGKLGCAEVEDFPGLPAIWCTGSAERRLLIANPGPETVLLRLPEVRCARTYRSLDETTVAAAMADPRLFRTPQALRMLGTSDLELPPWGYLCIIEEHPA